MIKKSLLMLGFAAMTYSMQAQTLEWVSSSDNDYWYTSKIKLEKSAKRDPILEVKGDEKIIEFQAWGGTFNEKGWDALNLLPRKEQEVILSKLFSPDGDLRYSIGRFSMNANDYARDWYSCDEVPGDFGLKYFNIDRDKTTLIPFIKAAQVYNPEMTFWISPWSPPSWMKINQYYSVVSNAEINTLNPKLDHLLLEGTDNPTQGVFPARLTVNDYFIQDPRYLQAYADYFCKFIEAYAEQGIPVTMAMFQNEAWSYTPYPGCAWTAEGIIRFNAEYLAPTLKEKHPEVELILGTINTNRFEVIDEVLSDPKMATSISGLGFQWEGGQLLPALREKYPQYKIVQTESECGWGSFDWGAGEHTFQLINHYLGNGAEEYTFWNSILADNGVSGWGWIQNSLIRVDSKTGEVTYTPEYYAAKHYCSFIDKGTTIMAHFNNKEAKTPVMIAKNSAGKYVVIAGNYNDVEKDLTVEIEGKFLNMTLKPHSFHTFKMK